MVYQHSLSLHILCLISMKVLEHKIEKGKVITTIGVIWREEESVRFLWQVRADIINKQ